jgi:hypothetical protein
MNLIKRVMGWLKKIFEPSFFAFDCYKQGYSHIKADKICQDFATSLYSEEFAVAIISDGHGGDDYFRSDIGSRFAGEIALQCVEEFVSTFYTENLNENLLTQLKENSDKYLQQLEMSIVSRWRKKTIEHYSQTPFSETEIKLMSEKARIKYEETPETRYVKAYGATLVVAVIVKNYFWFALQLGDGKCVALNKDNTANHPIPVNEKCFLNQTTSLCDDNPLVEFRHYFDTINFPQWIFVGSDGIEDSFNGDDGLNDFYKEVTNIFRSKHWKIAIAELNDYLPILSQKGSGDDMSISGIYNK